MASSAMVYEGQVKCGGGVRENDVNEGGWEEGEVRKRGEGTCKVGMRWGRRGGGMRESDVNKLRRRWERG